jgi:aspartate racemase
VRTAGIIGGIGPESTIEYYRLIIASYRKQTQDDSYPSIIINSIDLRKMLNLITANRLSEVTAYLAGEIRRLAQAGADLAVSREWREL